MLTCYHGNRTNRVQGCTKFNVYTHYHCQVINNKQILPSVIKCCHGNPCGRLYVSPKVYGHRYVSTAIFYLLQSYLYGCHGNSIIMLPWQPYKWCTNLCKVMLILYPICKNHNYKYYLWLIVVAMAVAMATIVVDYT